MVLDLKSVFVNENSSLPIDYSLDMSAVDFAGLYPLKKPVKIVGAVTNRSSLTVLEAKITYEYVAPCDRCGVEASVERTIGLSRSLALAIEGEESESILPVPDMKLDLDELVYSEVIVSLPMKHLCRGDCRGICPKCGKALNDGDCDCPKKEIDPRLSALAELLKS